MARKKSPTVTQAVYRVMDVIWNRETATVAEVVDSLGDPPLAYNSILTTMWILEQKGYVSHKAIVSHVVSRFFNNSPRQLVLHLIESDEAELAHLSALLERKRNTRDFYIGADKGI